MNDLILDKEVQKYIIEQSNSTIDLSTLILAGSPFKGIKVQELAQQIQGRRKAKTKLPTWYATDHIFYPPTLNLEQTSSEKTALYKSKLIAGDSLIDLTGGFGIDDYYFSKQVKKVIHCELNIELSRITAYNTKILKQNNIETVSGDSLETLKNLTNVDWIYADPSRRHDSKGKVFFLEDCLPNIPDHLGLLFSKSDQVLLKTSPLLDLHIGIKALSHVKDIHIVAVDNDVKELVWVLDQNYSGDIKITTVNIGKTGNQEFSFLPKNEAEQLVNMSLPQKYLYEPNAAILKSGGFLSIASAFDLNKLHVNSHLYTSNKLVDFPGRKFEIISSHPYQKKELSKLGITKANITTRNFSDSVSNIRKKFKIKDGGDQYLFFTTDLNGKKKVLLCKKCTL